MTEVKPPQAGLGRLRLGGYKDADGDDDVLPWYQRLHVTHVLCLTAEFTPPKAPGIVVRHLPIADDDPSKDLAGILPKATQFVGDALNSEGSCVLIHCRNGASRAACVTMAVLVTVYAYNLVDAYHFLLHRRRKMDIFGPFLNQLETWCRGHALGQ